MTVSASQPEGGRTGVEPSTVSASWRGLRTVAAVTVLALSGIGSGGCSMSYQLGSLFGKNDDKPASADAAERVESTGSTKAAPTSLRMETGGKISEADLAAATAAATDMLASSSKDISAPWQNPDTGARGTVTPIAAAYTQDGFTCRDFLASVVRDRAETWLQGEACRVHHGKWVVRAMKPWKRA